MPSVVVGHSVGEVAAAYAAGIFTAGQAISCAYHLGLAMLEMKGTMLHTEMQRKCLPTEARDATSVLPCCQLQPFFLFFFLFLVATASNLITMASNPIAMASNLIAMASNLIAKDITPLVLFLCPCF